LGAKQGEFLAVLIEQLEKRKGHQLWNTSFKRDAAMIPDAGPLPTIDYDGLKLTVLGPTQAALNRLGKEWNHVVEEYWTPGDSEAALAALKKDRRYRPGWLGARGVEDLADSEMNEDAAAANGSSIVLLAEYGVHRCLFAADAQPTPLTRALDRLSKKRLFLSVLKVPHHGSERNNSAELYRKIEAEEYLISTNGDRFAHPDDATVARILVNKPARARVVLRFNYASGLKSTWMADEVKERFKYSTEVPTEGNAGLRVIRED
jgi:hypothetical protein